jgi:hypothetical protein
VANSGIARLINVLHKKGGDSGNRNVSESKGF